MVTLLTLLHAHTDDLFASLIWFFDSEMERTRIYGLARDYVDALDTLTTIRGRIDISEQLRRQQLRPFPLECRFQEYTEDIPLNPVLKEAHAVALTVPQLQQDVAIRVGDRHRRFFAAVDSEALAVGGLPMIEFNHTTEQWRLAYWLAQLLLSYQSLRDEHGAVIGQAFAVRMDRVFERLIQLVVTEELKGAGFEVEPQFEMSLTTAAYIVADGTALSGVDMRPDLVVRHNGKPVAVADVKYKRTEDIGDFRNPDLYQLLVTAQRSGCDTGPDLRRCSAAHDAACKAPGVRSTCRSGRHRRRPIEALASSAAAGTNGGPYAAGTCWVRAANSLASRTVDEHGTHRRACPTSWPRADHAVLLAALTLRLGSGSGTFQPSAAAICPDVRGSAADGCVVVAARLGCSYERWSGCARWCRGFRRLG